MLTSDIAFYYLLSYLIGSIPTGFILFYIVKREDIRTYGSGNTGATNVLRNQGKLTGILTLVIDLFKGVIPVLYGLLNYSDFPEIIIIAGGLAILGHIVPVFLKFKGGKGVATFIGVFMMYSFKSILLFIIVFLIVLFYTRFVSLASVAGVTTVFFYITFTEIVEISIIVFLISIIILGKHRLNFIRIMNDNEPKIRRLWCKDE
jgi:glycerol-3-phosphate acyltransferase PlsY